MPNGPGFPPNEGAKITPKNTFLKFAPGGGPGNPGFSGISGPVPPTPDPDPPDF